MESLLIVIWVSKSSKLLQMANEDSVENWAGGGESWLFSNFSLLSSADIDSFIIVIFSCACCLRQCIWDVLSITVVAKVIRYDFSIICSLYSELNS